MKKFICIVLSVAFIVTLFSGCGGSGGVSSTVIIEEIIEDTIQTSNTQSTTSEDITVDTSSENNTTNESSAESKVDPSACSHQYDEKITQKAELFKMGNKSYTCTKCGHNYEKAYPVEKIKLLSISNSYGKNALWELYDICKSEGVKEIDIAVMYIAGCSLDKHWENMQNNAAEYEVFRNNNGTWTSTKNSTIDSLLAEGDWDIITTQNSSGLSGKADGYKNLNNVADYIKAKCPNSKLVWHLIWGYQSGSEWLKPTTYNGDEKYMFECILNCTNDIVIPSNKFDSVVPVGTAILNARTSNLKNIVHDSDGSHLSAEFGYYVAAFTWYCHITGAQPYDTAFAASMRLSNDKMDIAIESTVNAVKNPYKVTQSYYIN